MSTLAVVGAGPQLGMAVARRFAAEGFDVALVARTASTLEAMAEEVRATGVRALPLAADLRDRAALRRALATAEERLGPIDVLEWSPAPSPADLRASPLTGATEVTVESVLPEIETWLLGGITAIGAVLPGMLARGRGSVLVTTGAGSGPMVIPFAANVEVATAGLRNLVLNLGAQTADRGVYVAHVAVAAAIGEGRPEMAPEVMADAYWQLHVERTTAELVYPGLPDAPPVRPADKFATGA